MKHPYDRLAWVQIEWKHHRINTLKEKGVWVSRVAEHKGQPRKLWKAFSSIIGLDRAAEIPIATSPSAQELFDYFVGKIELIEKSTGDSPPTSTLPTPGETYSTFRTSSVNGVQKIFNSKPIKSCSQDPIPQTSSDSSSLSFYHSSLECVTNCCRKDGCRFLNDMQS